MTQQISEDNERTQHALKILVHNIPSGIWVSDEHGNIVMCNQQFANTIGLPIEIVNKANIHDFDKIYQESDESVRNHVNHIMDNNADEFEAKIVGFDRNERFIRVTYYPVNPTKYLGTVGIVNDITSQKRLLTELAKIKEENHNG